MKFVFLWTDVSIWLLAVAVAAYAVDGAATAQPAAGLAQGLQRRPGAGLVGRAGRRRAHHAARQHPLPLRAALGQGAAAGDVGLRRAHALAARRHAGAAGRRARDHLLAPARLRELHTESVEVDGRAERLAPRLRYGGAHLQKPEEQWAGDIARRTAAGLVGGAAVTLMVSGLVFLGVARRARQPLSRRGRASLAQRDRDSLARRARRGARAARCSAAWSCR